MHFEMQNLEEAEVTGDELVPNGGPRGQVFGRDTIALARSGKKQVLTRRFGLVSMTGFSCGLMCTWEGMLVTFSTGLPKWRFGRFDLWLLHRLARNLVCIHLYGRALVNDSHCRWPIPLGQCAGAVVFATFSQLYYWLDHCRRLGSGHNCNHVLCEFSDTSSDCFEQSRIRRNRMARDLDILGSTSCVCSDEYRL